MSTVTEPSPEKVTTPPPVPIQEAPASSPAAPEAPPKGKNTRLFVIFGGLLLLAAFFGFRTWSFNQTHASTDDAQIVADSVVVSPQVTGTVAKVLVEDNQLVKKGDLLVQLDDRSFQADLLQAQANLDAALAQAQGAGASVALTAATGNAQVSQAQGIVSQASSGIASAESDVAKASAGIASAAAQQTGARASTQAARSGIIAAESGQRRAVAAYQAAGSILKSAQAQVNSATANVTAAEANAALARKNADRAANLASQGATSQQSADAAAAAAKTAEATLESMRGALATANANVAEKQSQRVVAFESVSAAGQALQQARDQLRVVQSQQVATAAGYNQATAQRRSAEINVSAARAREAQALGELAQARTTGSQVDVSKTARLQAVAKVELARAAVAVAQLNLSYTKIYAVETGRVTKKNVDTGALVQAGTPLLVLVNESDTWVVANFKETQMPGIRPGLPVVLDVDGVPGVEFRGKVESVQAGTGATFSLLPPDNASGNFTKVVQRIPVKITLDPSQSQSEKLRSGMSANVTINLK